MIKYNLTSIIVIGLFSSFGPFEQAPIDVVESTIKVGALSEEIFYYGFSEGDQLIFNFSEVNGKELKEVEIIELPSASKFMDYKTKKINNIIISITTTGVYKFRFSNSALSGRICKFRIQRIPSSESTKNFNTSVYWATIYDTSYTIAQERFLIKSDTNVSNVTDQVAKVHSVGNLNGNKTTFNFTLPKNTIAWSYYIGVNQAGTDAYQKATNQISNKAAPLVAKIPGYGPLAALALGGMSYLAVIQTGEDIDFYIVNGNNVNLFTSGQAFSYLKKGKVINDFSRMTSPLRGSYHVCFANDNAVTGVTVAVKITAITLDQTWETRPVKKMRITTVIQPYLKN